MNEGGASWKRSHDRAEAWSRLSDDYAGMSKIEFAVKVCGVGEPIDLRHLGMVESELMPTEFHIKPDGDLDNMPSLAVVLVDIVGRKYVAQISARMMMPAIEKLMEIVRERKP